MKKTALSRRHFLQVSSLTTGGMLLGLSLFNNDVKADTPEATAAALNMYIKIGSDNSIVLLAPNPEIGQGVKTTLPVIVAEELCVDWQKVIVEFSPVENRYGRQTAGGSGSVRGRFTELRTAGAAAREMLIAAAAQTWNVSATECTADNGEVLHKASGKKLTYGNLAAKAATMEVPTKPILKNTNNFTYIGTRIKDVDALKIATGQPLFGIDTRKKGMLFAMIARSPAYGKTLLSVNDEATLKIEGVKQVVKLKNSVAVLATSTWAAKKGRDALVIEWKANEKLENSAEHFAAFRELLNKTDVKPNRNDGDIEAAKKLATQILDVTYEIPTLSHGQMEPLNFFANVQDGKVDLFGPTQVPAQLKSNVAKELGIPEQNITVGSPRQGGGFGRKLMADNGLEAALVSAAAKCPVQVQWTREDDMQNDFYRPAEMYRFIAALSADKLLAWHQSGVGIGRGIRGDSYVAGIIENYRSDGQGLTSNTPTGWWRAPGANTLAFVAESFMDEVCIALKKDPIAYRLELFDKAKQSATARLGYDVDKYKSVINLVAKISNWGTKKEGVYRGMATWFSFGSYAAQVIDIALVNGKPKILKVYCAVNCGRVVNLSGAENQVQGAIIDGICHAMYPKVTFVNGAVVETNFYTYPLLRINDAPLDIEVKFVESEEAPTGLGEPGLPPIAPALASAIYAATGKRIRKMPFIEQLS